MFLKIVRFKSGAIVKLIEPVEHIGYFCEVIQESKHIKKPKDKIYSPQQMFFYNFEFRDFSINGIEEIEIIPFDQEIYSLI